MEIRYTGGIFGSNIRPTPFLCLTLKMLQIQPEKDIVVEFIKNEEFKYVRALGAFYLRLTGTAVDCYKYLEPLYNDNRKLRHQNRAGNYEIVHMDEFIDQLLRENRVCDIILPRIQKRHILEENNELEPKVSALDDDLDEDGSDDEANAEEEAREDVHESKKKHKRESDRRDERKESDRRDSDRRELDKRYDRKYDDKDRKSDKYGDKYRDRDYERSRYEPNRRDDRKRDRERDRGDRGDRGDRKRHHDYDYDDYDYKRRH